MTQAERASALLRQALDSRADHPEFVAITSRRTLRGVLLLWRDYLTNEGGTLLDMNDQDIQGVVENLLSVLRQWRAAVSQVAKRLPQRSCGEQHTSRRTAA
jgi:hypothetical protein